MKVLVTGANGMLGSSLCWLYRNIHEVYAFHRDKVFLSSCAVDKSLDLMDSNQLNEHFSQIKPDLVIHSAGLTNVDTCEKEPALAHEMNVTITKNIARVCSETTKLIYISSDQVYGNAKIHSESNENLQPMNKYGKTKLLAEKKVQEHCKNHIIVRTNIFGWNVKPGKISSSEWIYHSLKKGEKITLFSDYTFSPIYTEFLGEIIMELVEMDFKGIINVGSSRSCSKYNFGIQLAEEFGLNSFLIQKGSLDDHSFSAPRFRKLDLNVSKLSGLDIAPPGYRLSIKQFVKHRKLKADHY